MSGVRLVQGPSVSNAQQTVLANSAVIDFQDFVKIDSSGFLSQVAAGDKIQGIYLEQRKTVTSDNQTVALAKGSWQPITDDMVFELTADQACVQTDLGAYADVAVSANAYTVNLSAGTSGQLEIIDFDPTTTTLVRCVIAEPEQLAFAQA